MGVDKRKTWVDYLKVIAAVCITNSHCGELYPTPLLAIGGGFGNAIFFAVSGYLNTEVNHTFSKWYIKKIKRLFPAVISVVIIGMIANDEVKSWIRTGNAILVVNFFIQKLWFISAIVIYYAIYYFVVKYKVEKHALIIWVLVYFFVYFTVVDLSRFSVELAFFSPFKVYYYFGIMIIGAFIRKSDVIISNYYAENEKARKYAIFAALAASVAWAVYHYMMIVFKNIFFWQFLVHLFIFIFAIGMLLSFFEKDFVFLRLIRYISNSTLEIYVIQPIIISQIVKRMDMLFPVNVMFMFIFSICGGVLLHYTILYIKNSVSIRHY